MSKPRRAVDCTKLPVTDNLKPGQTPLPVNQLARLVVTCFGDQIHKRLLQQQRRKPSTK